MDINIKDIIKPKFAKGQTVYINKGSGVVKKAVVQYWEVTVNSEKPVQTTYYVGDSAWYHENYVFATAEEAFNAKN